MASPPSDGFLSSAGDRSRYRPHHSQGFYTPRQEGPPPTAEPPRSRPAGVGISFSFQPGSSSARVSAVSSSVQAIRSEPRGLTVGSGDTLIGVNGRDVSGFPPVLLREELLGPPGSKVLLRFERVQEGAHGPTTVHFEIVAERGFVGHQEDAEHPPTSQTQHGNGDLKKQMQEASDLAAQRQEFGGRFAQAKADVEAARRWQSIAEEGEAKMSQEVKRLNNLLEVANKANEELQSTQRTRGEEVRALQMSLIAAQEDVNDGRQNIEWLAEELAKARDVCAAAQHKEAQMLAGREEERTRRTENASEVAMLEASKAELQTELSKERARAVEEEMRREEAERKADELHKRLIACESQRQELEGQLWMVEEGSGREALLSARLRSEVADWRRRAEGDAGELQDALEQREASEAALEASKKREEKAVKALEELRSKGGEVARGREAAERERDALQEELRRVSTAYNQLRDKFGVVEVSRARMQAEKVALAVRVRDLEEELEAEKKVSSPHRPRDAKQNSADAKEDVPAPFRLFDDDSSLPAAHLPEGGRPGGRQSPVGRREEGPGQHAGSSTWPHAQAAAGRGRTVRWDSEDGKVASQGEEARAGKQIERGATEGGRASQHALGLNGVADRGWGRLMAGEDGWDGWKVTSGELKVTRPPLSSSEEEGSELEGTVEAQQMDDVGVGINVEKNQDGGLRVSEVVEGMSGHLSGAISVDDEVVQVDGRPVQGLSIEDVARRVKGKDGTPVQLTLRTVKRTHGFAKADEGSKSVARDWEVTLLRGAWDYVDYFDRGASTFPMSPRTKRSPSHRM